MRVAVTVRIKKTVQIAGVPSISKRVDEACDLRSGGAMQFTEMFSAQALPNASAYYLELSSARTSA